MSAARTIQQYTNKPSEFFPERAFVQRVYGEEDTIPSYEDYADGRLPMERTKTPTGATGTDMVLFQRGQSRRVDVVLDWLVRSCCSQALMENTDLIQENGAFPAMQSGNLRALQVLVHASSKDRSKIIESYTFTIQYVRDAENRRVPAGIEVGRLDPDIDAVTVGETSRAVQQLVRQINDFCELMPRLPSEYIARCFATIETLLTLSRQTLCLDGLAAQPGERHPRRLDCRHF